MDQPMGSTILLDNDLKGHGLFIEVGWRETKVAHSLAAIMLYPEEKLGAGRVFLP